MQKLSRKIRRDIKAAPAVRAPTGMVMPVAWNGSPAVVESRGAPVSASQNVSRYFVHDKAPTATWACKFYAAWP